MIIFVVTIILISAYAIECDINSSSGGGLPEKPRDYATDPIPTLKICAILLKNQLSPKAIFLLLLEMPLQIVVYLSLSMASSIINPAVL